MRKSKNAFDESSERVLVVTKQLGMCAWTKSRCRIVVGAEFSSGGDRRPLLNSETAEEFGHAVVTF